MATVDLYAEISALLQIRQELNSVRIEALRLLAEAHDARQSLISHIDYASRQKLGLLRRVRVKARGSISQARRGLYENAVDLAKARALLPSSHAAIRRTRRPIWFGEYDRFVIREAVHLCRWWEAVTGLPWHIDHHFPLCGDTVSGLHVGLNLQVIPAHINMRKGNRVMLTEPLEWLSW